MQYSEFGSDAHFIPEVFGHKNNTGIEALPPDAVYYFSGRAALYGLLAFGIGLHGWKQVYLPEYYCHEVDHFISRLPVTIHYYNAGPWGPLKEGIIEDRPDTVIVEVNFFGSGIMSGLDWQHATLIEDHTHAPFATAARNSKADYCFASLRKALPIPAGGVAWSPLQSAMPPAPPASGVCASAAYMKLSAMLLKRMYLAGEPVAKSDFRQLFVTSEAQFELPEAYGALPEFLLQLTGSMAPDSIRQARRHNHALLCELILFKEMLWLPENEQDPEYLGLILHFKSAGARNAMKQCLIGHAIYPAVLWPEQQTEQAVAFSDRMLFVHCDSRYNDANITLMASVINNQINENNDIYTTG